MLLIQSSPNETPLSIEGLLEIYNKLEIPKKDQIIQTFIIEESHTPTDSPPYVATFFERGRQIITILSCILGYTTDEHVMRFSLLSFLSFEQARLLLQFTTFLSSQQIESMNSSSDYQMRESSNTLQCYSICSCTFSQTNFQSASKSQTPKTIQDLSSIGHH